MNLEQLIDYLSRESSFQSRVQKWMTIPGKEAHYVPFPSTLEPALIEAFRKKGINGLYSHQAATFDIAQKGENVVVVTPTASGKTLAYNLPVFNRLYREPETRALYLFPTKALAQDQLKEVEDINLKLDIGAKAFTFDGDTPADIRRTIRKAGHLVITNPDMLHQGILPHHTLWIKLFENLRYIIIDELHMYRGVFGSHVANVIARLKRICRFYGTTPQFIMSSATIHNPRELAETIAGEPVQLIDENGAPSGKKHFVLYNPPVVNAELGLRRGVVNEVKQIARKIIPTGAQVIIFARSRMRVELLVTYLRDMAGELGLERRQIRGYRGGYLPLERREIEKGVKSGAIRVVVSTNALELGIDIGQLDVAILAGYPGSIASAWQQAGRAGRRNKTSLTIMVASSAPLDQYLMENPGYFFGKNPETAYVDRENLPILISHVKCAAFELPFEENETFIPNATQTLLDYLASENILRKTNGRYFWMSAIYPADEVGLRNSTQENVVIIDTTRDNRVIGEMDLFGAQEMLHTEAIYIHNSISYYVDKLEWEERKAYVHRVDADHYTDAITKTDIKVLDVSEELSLGPYGKILADVAVARTVTGYKKIKFKSHENIGFGRVYLPEMEMQTTALLLRFSRSALEEKGLRESHMGEGLKSVAYALRNLAPLFIICDVTDIAVFSMVRDPFTHEPTLYVYDKYQGGMGLSKKLFSREQLLLEAARDHIRQCVCAKGCPSCIGPTLEAADNSKQLALILLNAALDG
ncbi:MAG: DEAD/DEAH box helicase [Calditrichaeota bacterium]|nr:MAG: DEAD/DEAH box helicase [Calditrichota bacterium]